MKTEHMLQYSKLNTAARQFNGTMAHYKFNPSTETKALMEGALADLVSAAEEVLRIDDN